MYSLYNGLHRKASPKIVTFLGTLYTGSYLSRQVEVHERAW